MHETTITVLNDTMEIRITITDPGTAPVVSGPPDRWDPGDTPEWDSELWHIGGEEPEEMTGPDAELVLSAFEDRIAHAVHMYLETL